MLMDHADAGGDGVVGTPYRGRLAAHADFAAVGLIKTVENRHERRLAGAILTHYSVDASFRHFKIDVAIGMDWPEALVDADQFDCGLCHALPVHVFIVGQVLTRHCSLPTTRRPSFTLDKSGCYCQFRTRWDRGKLTTARKEWQC